IEDPGGHGEEPSEPWAGRAGARAAAAEGGAMSCGEIEILLCDYVDGTLDAAEIRLVEEHLKSCAACTELAAESKRSTEFLERVAAAEPPAELLARILAETGSGRQGKLGRAKGFRAWLQEFL